MFDQEFGEITIRRSAKAKRISIGVAPDGRLRATMPTAAPQQVLVALITRSRGEISKLLSRHNPTQTYANGSIIGKSHSLIVQSGHKFSIERHQLKIFVTLPVGKSINDVEIQQAIRSEVATALRKEAKHYLPRRIAILAEKFKYKYSAIRFSHTTTRWGSCSTKGNITLNIALMQLPFELIDYVLIHELCHTKEMNHSKKFWELVGSADENYKLHLKQIKQYTPSL